jgi:hypothetical protein
LAELIISSTIFQLLQMTLLQSGARDAWKARSSPVQLPLLCPCS